MKKLLNELLKDIKGEKIYIFGVNLSGLVLAQYFKNNTDKEIIFLDNDINKRKQPKFMNIPCMLPDDIESDRSCIITARSIESQQAMESQIRSYGCKNVVIWENLRSEGGGAT